MAFAAASTPDRRCRRALRLSSLRLGHGSLDSSICCNISGEVLVQFPCRWEQVVSIYVLVSNRTWNTENLLLLSSTKKRLSSNLLYLVLVLDLLLI